MKEIYKITLLNWNEHNPHNKKSHKKTMIANNLVSDYKIGLLSVPQRWLFVCLLLIAGDSGGDTITLTKGQLNSYLGNGAGAQRSLDRLQELQLVTYEKITPFIKEIKEIKERKVNKRKEDPLPLQSIPTEQEKSKKDDSLENRQIWEAYSNAYRLRYGIDPLRNATVNTQVSTLRKKLGVDLAVQVVEFYLTHQDSWYVKNTHTFGLCLSNAETLRTQMLKGKAITGTMVRSFEKQNQMKESFEAIDEFYKEKK